MIKITQIDEDLNIFKNNKVVVWGANKHGAKMIDLFNNHGIKVFALCDFDETKNGQYINDVKVISIKDLEKLSIDGNTFVMQESPWFNDWNKVKELTKDWNVSNYLMIRETWHILLFKQRYELYKKNPEFVLGDLNYEETLVKSRKEELRVYAENCFGQPLHIICVPNKTGDHTLMEAFDINNISYTQLWHTSKAFDLNMFKNIPNKIKCFLGVRDPISHNLSWVYQLISRTCLEDKILLKRLLSKEEYFFNSYGDAQSFFDMWLEKSEYMKDTRLERPIFHDIQGITSQYKKYICDFTKYPFDKEKGYTIIKDGNIEIFMYQLEKLNNLAPEISEFLDISISKLGQRNTANDKWIADSYKYAQNNLIISQEYFDKCFNEEYVKHCYSDKDIELFKSKWRKNIKK